MSTSALALSTKATALVILSGSPQDLPALVTQPSLYSQVQPNTLGRKLECSREVGANPLPPATQVVLKVPNQNECDLPSIVLTLTGRVEDPRLKNPVHATNFLVILPDSDGFLSIGDNVKRLEFSADGKKWIPVSSSSCETKFPFQSGGVKTKYVRYWTLPSNINQGRPNNPDSGIPGNLFGQGASC
jgi:hypothetical protein